MSRFVIGIAGYMGSGKTSCCSTLAANNEYYVVDGDVEARKIMQYDDSVRLQLVQNFGPEVVDAGGVVVKKLGALVFNDQIKLQKLNAIVHPLLLDRLRKTIFERTSGIIIVDAALLPLWNIEDWFDLRIWIDAAFATRCARLAGKGLALTVDELRTRMMQQELLFSPPAPERWTYIANEQGRDVLDETVRACIQQALGRRL